MFKLSPSPLFFLGLLCVSLLGCGGGTSSSSDTSSGVVTGKPQTSGTTSAVKSHTGHYMVLANTGMPAQLQQLSSSSVTGVVKHYSWNELEPAMGSYDFSQIRADVAEAALQKKYLLVQIDLDSRDGARTLPVYLTQNQMVVPAQNGAATLKIWDAYVVDRLKSLYAELAAHMDNEAYFEGLIIQPPGVQLTEQLKAKYAYSVETHRDAMIELLKTTKAAFNTANVFWSFANMTENLKLDNDIATSIVASRITMGGADLRADNPHWQTIYQPIYSAMKGQAMLFAVIGSDAATAIKSAAKSSALLTLLQTARERDVKYVLWEQQASAAGDANPWANLLSALDSAPK